MRNLEKCILEKTLATLRLDKARQEFGKEYIYGFDDVEQLLTYQIEILGVVAKEQTETVVKVKSAASSVECSHCGHNACNYCCKCNEPLRHQKKGRDAQAH